MLIKLRNSVADVLVKFANIVRYDSDINLFNQHCKKYNPNNDKSLKILFENLYKSNMMNSIYHIRNKEYLYHITKSMIEGLSTSFLYSCYPMTGPVGQYPVMETNSKNGEIHYEIKNYMVQAKSYKHKAKVSLQAVPDGTLQPLDNNKAILDMVENQVIYEMDQIIIDHVYDLANNTSDIRKNHLYEDIYNRFSIMSKQNYKYIIVNKKTLKKLSSLPEYKIINDIVYKPINELSNVIEKAGMLNDIVVYLNTTSPKNDILFVSCGDSDIHKPISFNPYVLINNVGVTMNNITFEPESYFVSRFSIGNRNINYNQYSAKAEVK